MTSVMIRILILVVAIGAVAAAVPAHAAPTCWGRAVTVWGTPGDDVIHGTSAGEVIHGRGGDDIIYSHNTNETPSGPDFICGGSGTDTLRGSEVDEALVGGFGHDTLEGGGAADGDLLVGGPGNDSLDGGAGSFRTRASYERSLGPIEIALEGGRGTASGQGRDTLTGIWQVVGSDFSDRISAGVRRAISGRGGDDIITVNPSSVPDWVAGGRGDDTITVDTTAFEGQVLGGLGDDVLRGSLGEDSLLEGGPGSDRVSGRAGIDDLAVCGAGDDSGDRDALDGGPGEDEVTFAGCGAAVNANLSTGEARMAGELRATLSGFENLEGSPFGDVLVGDPGPNAIEDGGFGGVTDDDEVVGSGGDDYLLAVGGRDRVRGSRGDDFLDVRDKVSGNDSATGGRGTDGCRADPGDTTRACET
jgi:Ca2+-binding RTX toxin-like protein